LIFRVDRLVPAFVFVHPSIHQHAEISIAHHNIPLSASAALWPFLETAASGLVFRATQRNAVSIAK
jgi:hypothetical protein